MKKNKRIRILSYILILCIITIQIPVITLAEATLPKMEDGVLKWTTQGKKASGSIRYRTVGWMVHTEEIPSGEIARSGKRYGRINMEQKGEIDAAGGEVVTFFESNEEAVKYALATAKNKNNKEELIPYKNGQVVYVSSIMVVKKGDKTIKGPFYNLSDIKKAEPWARPGDLDQYYNLPVKLDLKKEPIEKKVFVNGNEEKSEYKHYGLVEVGTAKQVDFKGKINYKDRQATLKETYMILGGEGGKKQAVKAESGKDSSRMAPSSIYGTKVIGEYIADVRMTVEHVDAGTGKLLKEPPQKEDLPYNPKGVFKAEMESFDELGLLYSEISYDNGKSWKDRNYNLTTRNVTTDGDTIIRFYYGKDKDLVADLQLTANLSAIEAGEMASVEFTLNANGSKSKNKILKYLV